VFHDLQFNGILGRSKFTLTVTS